MPRYQIEVWINWGVEMDRLRELNQEKFKDRNFTKLLTEIAQRSILDVLYGNEEEHEFATSPVIPDIPQGLTGNYTISDIDGVIENLNTIKQDIELHLKDLNDKKRELVNKLNSLKKELEQLLIKKQELELEIKELEK